MPVSSVVRFETDVLVVGGGTAGVAAAIAAARLGVRVILAHDGPWLGGMLTAAGVCAPDGNETLACQTGLWGAFLRELERREPTGLDHAWVSFFTYRPAVGAAIWQDWARSLADRLSLLGPVVPVAAQRSGDRLTGVRFAYLDDRSESVEVTATVTIEATELGDLLALADVPHRWGWDWPAIDPDRLARPEPSAPAQPTAETARFPVQSPTWVVYLEDYGARQETAPPIAAPDGIDLDQFAGAWAGRSVWTGLNYGRIPGGAFMLNWPIAGNDYAQGLDRLIGSPAERRAFDREAQAHSQAFAYTIQQELGRAYGLARGLFPPTARSPGGAWALMPYYRESRRVIGLATVTEPDLLPVAGGWGAALPIDPKTGETTAIAIGNYANDHHYPGWDFPLAAKSRLWGGRWTGTTFAIPYGALVPATIDGLLVSEKAISVSHIANGSTRLQPVVLGLGQAAGVAAALCVQRACQPRDLPVRSIQDALLNDPIAPAAIVPSFDLTPDRPDWRHWQQHWRDRPDDYLAALTGQAILLPGPAPRSIAPRFTGQFQRLGDQAYRLVGYRCLDRGGESGVEPEPREPQLTEPQPKDLGLVTLRPAIDRDLAAYPDGETLTVQARYNPSGQWLLVEAIEV